MCRGGEIARAELRLHEILPGVVFSWEKIDDLAAEFGSARVGLRLQGLAGFRAEGALFGRETGFAGGSEDEGDEEDDFRKAR